MPIAILYYKNQFRVDQNVVLLISGIGELRQKFSARVTRGMKV